LHRKNFVNLPSGAARLSPARDKHRSFETARIAPPISPAVISWKKKNMHLWHNPLSSKDLLEACVVFAMAFTFVIAFRWKR
jgi:hypothetical protein